MSTNGYFPMLPLGKDDTRYRLLTKSGVETVEVGGRKVLRINASAIEALTREAFSDVAHLLRPDHLRQLANILDDPEASDNDRFVALEMLKNANIAAGGVLPMCQDTGTTIVMGKKGENVWVEGDDEAAISEGIRRTYTETNLRYSQLAPLSMYEEKNTGDNLPAQIELYAEKGCRPARIGVLISLTPLPRSAVSSGSTIN